LGRVTLRSGVLLHAAVLFVEKFDDATTQQTKNAAEALEALRRRFDDVLTCSP